MYFWGVGGWGFVGGMEMRYLGWFAEFFACCCFSSFFFCSL